MSSSRSLRRGIVAATLLVNFLLQGTWALAGTTGGLAGTVKDPNGAPIAGVKVEAVSPSQTATSTTDAGGHFDLLSLAPDTYTLDLTKEGYTPVALPGNVVFADQTIQVNATLAKSLKQIARVTATAASSLVKPGVGGDLYSVNSTQIQAASSSNGGGNLNSAYSAISSVPGVYVGAFGMGWNQQTVVRGENPFFTGFEYDGIPVNRSFDNYNSSTESNLGLQQLEVYTGGGPSSIASNGVSGFINQVIKTGTYPGYATISGGVGSPSFYHQAEVEAGGATPDRNFSYYVGISGYNQTFNYFNNQNGIPFNSPGGVLGIYSEIFSPTASGQADIPLCSPNVIGPGGSGIPYGAPGCYSFYDGFAPLAQQITDRENVVNLHLGIPRPNGQRDDVQLLWSASALREVFNNSPSAGSGLNYASQSNSGYPYIPGENYPHYNDALAYNLPFGTSIASSPAIVSAPGIYYQPNTPTNRAFMAQMPTSYFGDVNNNDTGIVKLQYTHPFNDRSFVRVFGYTFFSDWTEDGQMGAYSPFFTSQPISPNYNLITHTSGAELQYSNQLNDQDLVTFTGNWTTASVDRLNNEYWENGASYSPLISPAGPACGGSMNYTLDESALATAQSTGSAVYPCLDGFGASPIGYMHIGGTGKHQFTCYTPSGAATPCLPDGSWESNAFLGPNCSVGPGTGTTSSVPHILCTPYTPVAGASWVSLWNGNNNGPLNEVRPEFGNLSLSDEIRPNDKWLIDASLKYDNFNYALADSTTLGDQFAAYQVANYACVNAKTGAVLVSPILPGEIPPPNPILTSASCDDAYKGAYPQGTQTTGWVHPNGTVQNGVASRAFTNVSPPGYDQYYYSPRLAATYTSDPDNVFRFSGGRYTEPPLSASVQYLYTSGSGATNLWTNFLGDGYYSPFHPIPGMTSAQYDASWEHRVKNTDWSFKLSPFFTQTSNWEQQAFIGDGFVTQVPVGRFQSEGAEFSVQKGNFARNGLAGQLSFTYTHAVAQYQQLLVANQANTMNTLIEGFNQLTKAGGGSPCYAPFNGTTVVSMPCSKPQAIRNPYYDMAQQGTIDPNGWYPASEVQLPPAFGPNLGVEATSYTSPYVASAILNYRQNKLAITPSIVFQSGVAYGSPMDVAGVDPRVCRANQTDPLASTGFKPVPDGNGQYCNYLSQAGVGANGYLYIPNPQTGHFADLGQYIEPNLVTANLQVSYDVSPQVRLVLTGANLFRSCFGGSAEPWTAAYPPSPNYCGYSNNGSVSGANLYTSNYYNGNSPTNRVANPGGGTMPQLLQSYTPTFSNGTAGAPLPFTLFVQAQIKI